MTNLDARAAGYIELGADRPSLPLMFRFVLPMLNGIERGSIEIGLPNGQQVRAIGNQPGPDAQISVLNRRFIPRLLLAGDQGFGEMFMDGWWTSADLQSLLDVILLNNENMARRFPGAGLFRLRERLRHNLNGNSRRGSQRNIAHHYDLGNDFYSLWLDRTMTYSSALFRTGQESLEEAQTNKYAAICDLLAASYGDRVLEIGCGWGGFAEYAVRERGLRVTALTISREQHEHARRRLFEAGLADRAEVLLRDYRDERGVYDRIASIEMIEAVGEKFWPAYFSALHDRLRPGGIAALQAITIADRLFPQYRARVDFVQKHIFPGGLLPSPGAMESNSKAAGLETIGVESSAESYSQTLRMWRARFNDQWEKIARHGFDRRFHRMWNFYLAASAAGFAAGTTDVVRIAYRRPG